ncbi:MAG TPA: NAD(+) diphosphatase [Rhizomicrobium sp.]|jgi:NAD+ diphosphatase|nr:NAD(+) diphosphatase [Rhizomicrobium sp.]
MMPFAGSRLDRASHRRTDSSWISARLADPSTLMLPLWNLQPLLLGSGDAVRAAFFAPGVCEQLAAPDAASVFLGVDSDRAVFALDISAAAAADRQGPLAGRGQFRDLRAAAPLLPHDEIAILGQAKALIDWHQRHGFCPRCGARTRTMDSGYRRLCPNCGAEHFPRTDPVVIMLAHDGDDCLVGHGQQFQPQMYSALAGYVEPGETIEEAVRREILEETAIRTGRVTYYATQPWPFPSSLMIGCLVEALSREIVLDTVEMADARWLDRNTARALLSGATIGGIRIPPPLAIAHHLIRAWVNN